MWRLIKANSLDGMRINPLLGTTSCPANHHKGVLQEERSVTIQIHRLPGSISEDGAQQLHAVATITTVSHSHDLQSLPLGGSSNEMIILHKTLILGNTGKRSFPRQHYLATPNEIHSV